jgi:predicted subunit of tRNA(5-methylaminomethyl-2-thiouridylate) methyltransferase
MAWFNKNGPPRNGLKWKSDEIIQLLEEVSYKSITDIAKIHERTPNSITAKLNSLAADYFFNDNKSIDEITELVGLPKSAVDAAIQKRILENKEAANKPKAKEKAKEPKVNAKKVEPDAEIESEIEDPMAEIQEEILEILKDIQFMMRKMLDNKPKKLKTPSPVISM